MGWDNPPVPWREFERRLSWRQSGKTAKSDDAPGNSDAPDNSDAAEISPVTPLPVTPLPVTPPVPWAELHCHSSYSFLDGASAPSDLICEAAKIGLTAIAITDHDGMYGVPQFAQAATRFKSSKAGLGSDLATVFGAELSLDIPAASTRAPPTAVRAPQAPPPGTPRAG